MKTHTILWRNLEMPGHDSCQLLLLHTQWRLTGTAVFSLQQEPCRLDYLIACDLDWRIVSAKLSGWVGNKSVNIQIAADGKRRWVLNSKERPEALGCLDLDLNFTPATHLPTIRRLGLAVGQSAEVRAAWVRFPAFELEPMTQLYRRVDDSTYRVESKNGQFDLQVDASGFVTSYPGRWQAESMV